MAHPPAFKTTEGEAAYLAAYEAAMSLWPNPYEEIEVPTRFGSTHVVTSGPECAPPMVLLHGYFGTLTMWSTNIADFSEDYRPGKAHGHALQARIWPAGASFSAGEFVSAGNTIGRPSDSRDENVPPDWYGDGGVHGEALRGREVQARGATSPRGDSRALAGRRRRGSSGKGIVQLGRTRPAGRRSKSDEDLSGSEPAYAA